MALQPSWSSLSAAFKSTSSGTITTSYALSSLRFVVVLDGAPFLRCEGGVIGREKSSCLGGAARPRNETCLSSKQGSKIAAILEAECRPRVILAATASMEVPMSFPIAVLDGAVLISKSSWPK